MIYGTNPTRCGLRRAMTLVELVVSLTIVSVLMGATGSIIVLAARAIPDGQSPTDKQVSLGVALDRMTEELGYATGVTALTSWTVEFTTADRTGDGLDETIRYEWSGTAGDPLTRSVNGAPPVTVAENVLSFALSWNAEESAETLTSEQTQSDVLLSRFAGTGTVDGPISQAFWIAQHVRPVLPEGTVRWRITRVLLRMRADGALQGELLAQVRPVAADDGPAPSVREERAVSELSLPLVYAWHEVPFARPHEFSPDESVYLVLQHVSDTSSGDVSYVQTGSTLAGSSVAVSTDGGGTWNVYAGGALSHEIYGEAVVRSNSTVTRSFLTAFTVNLRAETDTSASLQSAVSLPNKPEVP